MLIVPSRITDALWPAIPTSRASQLLAVQFQLDQSQWLSTDQLRALQWQQLQRLVHHAHQHVPFYRSRLDSRSYARQSVEGNQPRPPSGDGSYVRQNVGEPFRLTRLREIRTFGEVVEPQLRAMCRQQWGVPLTDICSTQEIGYVAVQCPEVEGLHELTCVRQFQVIQRSLTELQVNLRVTRPLTDDEKAVIRRTLVSGLGYAFQIDIVYVDSIARSSSGKFEDFRCDLVDPSLRPLPVKTLNGKRHEPQITSPSIQS